MSSFIKKKLSASTDAKGIKISSIETPGTLIHTSVVGTNSFDEIWIWATNLDTVTREITLEWGDASYPDSSIKFPVAAQDGLKLIIPGLILQNSLEVRAFTETIDVLIAHGFVNLIS